MSHFHSYLGQNQSCIHTNETISGRWAMKMQRCPAPSQRWLSYLKLMKICQKNFEIKNLHIFKMALCVQVLRFYGSEGVTVTGITIQNSPQTHLKFDTCKTVQVSSFTTSSPGDSPNTDGIHVQNSQDVLIYSSNLACGNSKTQTSFRFLLFAN